MASVRSSMAAVSETRMRRVISHEPGQRVMTEAIAFLFAYSTTQYKKPGFICPGPDEFFTYVRSLALQTYHRLVPGPRRAVSVRLLGVAGGAKQFESFMDFLNFIEPRRPTSSDPLIDSLYQALSIGVRALSVYTSFIDCDESGMERTHIYEPINWYCGILFHDALRFRERLLGGILTYIGDSIVYMDAHVRKNKVQCFFYAYSRFAAKAEGFDAFEQYLKTLFSEVA